MMLKFFKILLQKLFEKKTKDKSLTDFIRRKKSEGDLPEDVEVKDIGKGVIRIKANSELSFEQITDLIEGFIKEKRDGEE